MTFDISNHAYIAENGEYCVEIESQFMSDESIEDVKFYNVRIEEKNDTTYLLFGDFTMLSEYIIDFDLGDLVEEHHFDKGWPRSQA